MPVAYVDGLNAYIACADNPINRVFSTDLKKTKNPRGHAGEVQTRGEADEAPGDPGAPGFDGRGGLGLDAADEGGGIAEGLGGSLGAPGGIGGSRGVNP